MSNKLGFTLIELIISISIGIALLSVVVVNYNISNDNLAINSAAQEVAIAMRQAQAYGLAVRGSGTGATAFASGYGVYFNPQSPTTYVIFVDKNIINDFYDVGTGACGSATTECIQTLTLRNGVRFTAIQDSLGTTPGGGAPVSLNVTFKRPNPDAVIYFKNSIGTTVLGPTTFGRVVMTSPRGNTASVAVESTGQILVQ